jgi:hypothetical protein
LGVCLGRHRLCEVAQELHGLAVGEGTKDGVLAQVAGDLVELLKAFFELVRFRRRQVVQAGNGRAATIKEEAVQGSAGCGGDAHDGLRNGVRSREVIAEGPAGVSCPTRSTDREM